MERRRGSQYRATDADRRTMKAPALRARARGRDIPRTTFRGTVQATAPTPLRAARAK